MDETATTPRVAAVMPRDGLRIWVCFADGEHGEVDVSFLEVGGRWKTWDTREYFECVRVDPESGYVYWGTWFDPASKEDWVCLHPKWLYAKVTGSAVEDSFAPAKPLPQWDDSLPLPAQVKPCEGFSVWVRFDDAAEGIVDLSPAAGRWPVLDWDDRRFFESVRIDRLGSVVAWAWSDDHFVYLDPEWLYAAATGGDLAETWWSPDKPVLTEYGGPQPPRPVEVEAVDGLSIRVRFDDGTEGVADLSRHEGKGIWRPLSDRRFFESVRIDPESGAVSWGDDFVDVCPDWLYMEITGKTLEEHMPGLAAAAQQRDA